MGTVQKKPGETKTITHHLEEWNIFRILADEKQEVADRGARAPKNRPPIPHHIDEIDIFVKLLH